MYYFNEPVSARIDRRVAIDILRKSRVKNISVTFYSRSMIKNLNRKFRGQNKPTDVLAFAGGDIVICPASAALNARRYGNSRSAELLYLLIHAACHLRGYDHSGTADSIRMRAAENKLLAYVRKKYKIQIVGRI